LALKLTVDDVVVVVVVLPQADFVVDSVVTMVAFMLSVPQTAIVDLQIDPINS